MKAEELRRRLMSSEFTHFNSVDNANNAFLKLLVDAMYSCLKNQEEILTKLNKNETPIQ